MRNNLATAAGVVQVPARRADNPGFRRTAGGEWATKGLVFAQPARAQRQHTSRNWFPSCVCRRDQSRLFWIDRCYA
jgi:hypothetical protein